MSNINSSFKVQVTKLAFRFDLDGSITPFIDIHPAIPFENDQLLPRLAIDHPLTEISSLAVGDILEVGIKPEKVSITIVDTGPHKRIDFSKNICPVCHSTLLPGITGIGRCLNRDCAAQMSYSSILFLSSLGFALHYPIKKVLDSLLVRGVLDRLGRIFRLTEDEIVCTYISTLEAQTFLHYIHSARSKIRLTQLLQALRIPDLSEEWCVGLEYYLQSKHKNFITELPKYLDQKDQNKTSLPIEGWNAWNTFFSIPNNQRLLKEMLVYLQP